MLLLVSWLLGASPMPPPPTTAEAKLTELRAAVERKAWLDAAGLTRELERLIAHEAPLWLTDGRALSEPAAGLGIYRPLPGGRVQGEELFLYAAVQHHGLRAVADGYELHLVSDLVILDETGAELARDEAFGESRYRAAAAHRDTFVNIAVRVIGLPAGAYRARLVVHDRVAGKKAQLEIPFVIP